jgi:glycosyltransferase involved in cell wall biosynthesis
MGEIHKLKIAIATRRYYPEVGGVETHVKEIAERIAQKHEVTVFTLFRGGLRNYETINGVKVRRFNSLKLSSSIEFPNSAMLEEIRKFRPDVIHSHNIHTMIPQFAAKAQVGSKIIITPHFQGDATTLVRKILLRVYKPILQKIVSKADRIICVSPSEQEMLKQAFHLDISKTRLIPNGVGADLSTIVPDRKELRILSVARFDVNHKRTDKLIRAFSILDPSIKAKLVLVGSGPDKEMITNLVSDLGLVKRVEIKSGLSREELLQEYAKATIFVTASEHEAFGIAVAEALAAKLKVIVPNSTGLSTFVNRGYALGMEIPITPERIAQTISSCLRNNQQMMEYSAYTWDMAAETTLDLYAELVRDNN